MKPRIKTEMCETKETEEKEFNEAEKNLTPLHHQLLEAVDINQLEEVRQLINAGVNPNFLIQDADSQETSPLNIAVSNFDFEMTRLLLRHGADPNLQPIDTDAWNVFFVSSECCSIDKNLFLYKNKENDKIICYHIEENGIKHELETESLMPFLSEEKFDQPKENAKKCENKKLCDAILKITTDRDHTRGSRKSIVELLMVSLGNLSIDEHNGIFAKKSLKLFGKSTSFKIKVINTPEKVQVAHRILDLLLCYGLKPTFEWTKQFDKSIKQLTQCLEKSLSTLIKNRLSFSLVEFQLKKGIKRTLFSKAAKNLFKLRDYINKSPSQNNILDFVRNTHLIKDSLQEAASEIQKDKEHLLTEYKTKIAEGGAILPVALIDIIMHYAISSFSFNQEIALRREDENRTLQFWVDTKINKDAVEQEANFYAQYTLQFAEYEKATRHLKSLIGKEGQKILF